MIQKQFGIIHLLSAIIKHNQEKHSGLLIQTYKLFNPRKSTSRIKRTKSLGASHKTQGNGPLLSDVLVSINDYGKNIEVN